MMLQIGQKQTEITVAKLLLAVISLKYLLEIGLHAASLSQLGMRSLQLSISKVEIAVGLPGRFSSGLRNEDGTQFTLRTHL